MDWEKFERARALFGRYGVRPLIGVIPENRCPKLTRYAPREEGFWALVRELQGQGWGVALHGYRHVAQTSAGGWYGVSGYKSEFAGVDAAEQREAIARGARILRENGVAIDCFMAPWHAFDGATIDALKAAGIFAVTDGYALFPYERRGVLFVPQVAEKALPVKAGVQTLCQHVNNWGEGDFAAMEALFEARGGEVITFAEALLQARSGLVSLADQTVGHTVFALLAARRRLMSLRGSLKSNARAM